MALSSEQTKIRIIASLLLAFGLLAAVSQGLSLISINNKISYSVVIAKLDEVDKTGANLKYSAGKSIKDLGRLERFTKEYVLFKQSVDNYREQISDGGLLNKQFSLLLALNFIIAVGVFTGAAGVFQFKEWGRLLTIGASGLGGVFYFIMVGAVTNSFMPTLKIMNHIQNMINIINSAAVLANDFSRETAYKLMFFGFPGCVVHILVIAWTVFVIVFLTRKDVKSQFYQNAS